MPRANTRSNEPALPRREADRLAATLLAWYARHHRRLPWRARPGRAADPYQVWLSEVMLQQTTVKTVTPHFRAFIRRWPTVGALAAAELDEVLHAWQGLGYYARARNLHRCAQVVSRDHAGRFPTSETELRRLPGIGAYTAAAIAAIAYGLPAVVVDGNVERVVARLFAVEEPLPRAKARLRALAAALASRERPGDQAQAMMDLGATVCTPRRPRCALCPWREQCRARRMGIAELLPRKQPKRERPLRKGIVFWLVRQGGEVLLRKRAAQGLLGGLMEVPSTAWREAEWTLEEALAAAPAEARWRPVPGVVRHGFTHFELELRILVGRLGETAARPRGVDEGQGPRWCRLDRLSDYALPTVMKKVVAHALASGR